MRGHVQDWSAGGAVGDAAGDSPVMAQTALIRPNENLVAEGIPEIPAALAEKVQRYTESRLCVVCGVASAASGAADFDSFRKYSADP